MAEGYVYSLWLKRKQQFQGQALQWCWQLLAEKQEFVGDFLCWESGSVIFFLKKVKNIMGTG